MKIINIDNFKSDKILLENQNLYTQVIHCILGYNKLLLAYSGGLDSTVLLDVLITLIKNYNSLLQSIFPVLLRAVYVHHGISNQADKWANHCRKQCEIRNIPFDIIYINRLNTHKKNRNIESIARNLRYKGLCNYLSVNEVLLTAHHIDDQLETVLLALKRGSGPSGLSGINKNIILYNQHKLLRPLLNCTRTQLKKYAIQKKLTWIEDDTNIDTRFDRNFLRIQIIPLLKQRWPTLNKVVARTAQLCKNQENLLHELLSESLKKLVDTDNTLFFHPILNFSSLKRQAIFRLWLKKFFINMPSYQLLNRIWTEVVLSKTDANPILYLGKYICRRFHKKLYILPTDMAASINFTKLSWHSFDTTMILPYQLGSLTSQMLSVNDDFFKSKIESNINSNILLNVYSNHFKTSGKILTNCIIRYPQADEKISIRFGNVNGLLYILNRNRGRKLKKIWQELCIPPWLRSRIPLLFYNDILIAAIGVFITQAGKITNTKITTNNHSTICRIFWSQDSIRYIFFKNIIHHFLK